MKREEIERLPTALRSSIVQTLERNMEIAKRDYLEAATSYTMTTDEQQRSRSLIAQGEYNAFTTLYNIFK